MTLPGGRAVYNEPWTPVGMVITVNGIGLSTFEDMEAWLVERAGPQGVAWNMRRRMVWKMSLGTQKPPPGFWREFSIADPNIAFEFKMRWG